MTRLRSGLWYIYNIPPIFLNNCQNIPTILTAPEAKQTTQIQRERTLCGSRGSIPLFALLRSTGTQAQKCWHCLQIKNKVLKVLSEGEMARFVELGRFRSHPGRMRSCVLAGRRPKGSQTSQWIEFVLPFFFGQLFLFMSRTLLSEFFFQNYFLPWQYITLKKKVFGNNSA